MFDKLDDLLVRFEELLNELGEPGVTDDPAHFQKLMKEQSDLQPIVDAYKEYKKNKEAKRKAQEREEKKKKSPHCLSPSVDLIFRRLYAAGNTDFNA